jgi:hypothetical protein
MLVPPVRQPFSDGGSSETERIAARGIRSSRLSAAAAVRPPSETTTSSPSIATRYVRWSEQSPRGRTSLPLARSNT